MYVRMERIYAEPSESHQYNLWEGEKPTSICTASTVFSSPCRRNSFEALRKKAPNRFFSCVMYWCRESVGSDRANPEIRGSMDAIISIASWLVLIRLKLYTFHRATYRISEVLFASRRCSRVISSLTKVGMPEKALRIRFRCLEKDQYCDIQQRGNMF